MSIFVSIDVDLARNEISWSQIIWPTNKLCRMLWADSWCITGWLDFVTCLVMQDSIGLDHHKSRVCGLTTKSPTIITVNVATIPSRSLRLYCSIDWNTLECLMGLSRIIDFKQIYKKSFFVVRSRSLVNNRALTQTTRPLTLWWTIDQ
jgi:hypothetical protein